MKKYTVTFQVTASEYNSDSLEDYEYYLKDLINKAVFPALNLELVPLTFTVKKARKQATPPPRYGLRVHNPTGALGQATPPDLKTGEKNA